MYNFKDKTGLEVSLRPEMTPSLARLILKEGKALILPIKWSGIFQCWRYETVTKGRKREHYQWNMDIWGIKHVTAEAELISSLVSFFQNVGLTSNQIEIRFSSRKILQIIIDSLKISDDKFEKCCVRKKKK